MQPVCLIDSRRGFMFGKKRNGDGVLSLEFPHLLWGQELS